jgi:hypothetical protein
MSETIFVKWEKPRVWRIRLYTPSLRTGGFHSTLSILASSVDRAIEVAQQINPDARIESANDAGGVDIILDAPQVDVTDTSKRFLGR